MGRREDERTSIDIQRKARKKGPTVTIRLLKLRRDVCVGPTSCGEVKQLLFAVVRNSVKCISHSSSLSFLSFITPSSSFSSSQPSPSHSLSQSQTSFGSRSEEIITTEMADAETGNNEYTLSSVRESLVRQEDTIIFNLIERVKFPINSPTYHQNYTSFPGFCGSVVEFVVKNTEAIQAKAGRYKNPEENPFFPENLPPSFMPHYHFSKILHPEAALVNINKSIWKVYFDEVLPLFVASGDDGNYAQTAASDLSLLQAISRRIHYGKFVAEVKFRESPQDYEPLIRARDREGLMKLLTFASVEEMVKKRVEKKARVFGQEVSLERNDDDDKGNYKVDPSLVSRLYDKWVIPLTKDVEVEYLLRRLD